ncbi:hypothetical protein GW17_00031262 [Ensete ventricosum]|nr:hypothetical protein GW17_00031262 [Ensete ventricosum]
MSSSVRVMDGASGIATEAELGPEVVGRMGNPEPVAISSSLGVLALMDTKVFVALIVIQSCHNYDSIVRVQRLAEIWQRFFILRKYELHFDRILSLRNEVLELKASMGPNTVVVVEKRAADLEIEVGRLKGELGDVEWVAS